MAKLEYTVGQPLQRPFHFINIFPEGPTVFQTGKELPIEFQRILKYNFPVIIIPVT